MPAVLPWSAQSPVILLLVLISLLALGIVLALVHHGISLLAARISSKDDPPIERATRRISKWAMVGVFGYGVAYAMTWVWQPFDALFWRPALRELPSLLLVGGIIVIAVVALEALRFVVERIGKRTGGKRMSPRLAHTIETSFRYAVLVSAGAAVFATLLGILGYRAAVGATVAGWFRDQAGSLLLLGTLIGIGWLGGNILRAVTSEMRYSSKLPDGVVRALGGFTRGALYAILTLIGIFTLLSAIGLGSVGGTLVIVMSSFIGIVVAMAATGSIGNALSGAVLLAFRPLSKGDRVILDNDLVGDVEEVTLMFTRVRTVTRELVEVPNNQVLMRRMTNLSRSGPHAIVVKMGIGYDVPHAEVHRLAAQSSARTEGIVTEPAPTVYAIELGNFAISYQLHAYTRDPRHLKTRSALIANLQTDFGAAGVEILTPEVHILRTGPTSTVNRTVPVEGGPLAGTPPGIPPPEKSS